MTQRRISRRSSALAAFLLVSIVGAVAVGDGDGDPVADAAISAEMPAPTNPPATSRPLPTPTASPAPTVPPTPAPALDQEPPPTPTPATHDVPPTGPPNPTASPEPRPDDEPTAGTTPPRILRLDGCDEPALVFDELVVAAARCVGALEEIAEPGAVVDVVALDVVLGLVPEIEELGPDDTPEPNEIWFQAGNQWHLAQLATAFDDETTLTDVGLVLGAVDCKQSAGCPLVASPMAVLAALAADIITDDSCDSEPGRFDALRLIGQAIGEGRLACAELDAGATWPERIEPGGCTEVLGPGDLAIVSLKPEGSGRVTAPLLVRGPVELCQNGTGEGLDIEITLLDPDERLSDDEGAPDD